MFAAAELLQNCSEVVITEPAAKEIVSVVADSEAFESCGFLMGAVSGSQVIVKGMRQAENIYASDTRFGISYRDFSAAKEAEYPGHHVVGVVHAHFDSPDFSAVDMHQADIHQLIWLVLNASAGVATLAQNCKCFCKVRGSLREMAVQIGAPGGLE